MAQQPTGIGIVKVFKDTYLYNTAGGTRTNILVTKGATLVYFDSPPGWYGVFTVNPVSLGYISSNDSVAEQNIYNVERTTTAEALVYDGPGTFFSQADTLEKGKIVTTHQEANGFYRIGDEEWVSKQAFGTSIIGNINPIMLIAIGVVAYLVLKK